MLPWGVDVRLNGAIDNGLSVFFKKSLRSLLSLPLPHPYRVVYWVIGGVNPGGLAGLRHPLYLDLDLS